MQTHGGCFIPAMNLNFPNPPGGVVIQWEVMWPVQVAQLEALRGLQVLGGSFHGSGGCPSRSWTADPHPLGQMCVTVTVLS